jgi:hypothetical protein
MINRFHQFRMKRTNSVTTTSPHRGGPPLVLILLLCFPARVALSQVWQVTAAPTNALWSGVACSSNAAKIVATFAYGQIYTSTDSGASWTAREADRPWQAVASSADGVNVCAVPSGGTSRIYVSTNSGVDWAPRGPTNLYWTSVASSADGTRLVAGVSNGQLYTSADSGLTWVPRESSRNWAGVASSHDGSRLVAVAGSGQIYTSANFGTNWTPRESNRAWWGVASSADGSNLLASAFLVLDTLPGRLCVSTNAGVTWTSYQTNGNWNAVASSADGKKLLAINGKGLFISTNLGVTWDQTTVTDRWSAVACSWDGANLIAASDATVGTGGTGRIYVSPPLPLIVPSLEIFGTPTNTVVVRWPSPSTGWNLQQNTNVAGTNWDVPLETIANDGTNKSIIVNPPIDRRFFRLIKP